MWHILYDGLSVSYFCRLSYGDKVVTYILSRNFFIKVWNVLVLHSWKRISNHYPLRFSYNIMLRESIEPRWLLFWLLYLPLLYSVVHESLNLESETKEFLKYIFKHLPCTTCKQFSLGKLVTANTSNFFWQEAFIYFSMGTNIFIL
jgi:hypothetical protein